MKSSCWLLLVICALPFSTSRVSAQNDSLFGPAPSFSNDDHLVSTTFFHWFASQGGQLSGPWEPIEGRENWTGLPPWWKTQVKQIMRANIDVLYVHLIPSTEERRITFFQALYELRAEGYDIPKVAPFLDPLITWDGKPNIDVATEAGKDSLAAQYIRFYQQYLNIHTDPYATDYLAKINDRLVLDTWHVFLNLDNVNSLSRNDLESRLSQAFGSQYPAFNQGIYMVTTALNPPFYSFADERVAQFEINNYSHATTHDGLKSVQLKGGYWDQNIRTPGDFLPRDGGIPYANAWAQIDSSVDRIYLESWNEYDEGTGMYAADTLGPYILPGSGNTETDVWSMTNDPYEYIKTTAAGATHFNDVPELAAVFLRHDIPPMIQAGNTVNSTITVRNAGDALWTHAAGYRLQQSSNDPLIFSPNGGIIDDMDHDIPTLDGIFRGRPLPFPIELTAPDSFGVYETHWFMTRNDTTFGDTLTLLIEAGERTTSLADQLPVNSIHLFPNPFQESVQIKIDLGIREPTLELVITDLMGRTVTQLAKGSFPPGKHEFSWHPKGLAKGIYLCQLQTSSAVLYQKMLLK